MQTTSNQDMLRAFGRSLRRLARTAAALAFLAIPQVSLAADRYVPADPEPGTDMPKATIKFGMRPYADNTFYYIGMKKGWFDEVGISFDPAPYGMKANDSNVTTLLLNGQLDIISEFCPLMLPTYKDATTLKCIGFTDNFLANAILANPALKLKSFKDYIAEGMGYEDALKAALAPMKGKTLTGAPQLSDRAFEEYLNKTSGAGFKLQVLDDSKALVLAKSGQLDFLNPEGAPIVYTLRQAGWTSLVDIGDLIKYGPGGVDSPIEPLIGIVGVGANGDYVNKNPNTVLRFMSVVWRIIDATAKDPSLFELQAPYLNSFAGTDLDGKGVEETIKILDPLTPFEENAQYYDDPTSTTYFKNVWGAVIKDFEAHRVIPEGKATPEDVVWGADIWHLMVDYRKKSDDLLAKLEGASLSADKQELVKKARELYDAFDFLDSYRLLTAAAS
jgi:ABC-type nitrate/sulfonate/bicarbonate transport system substrate-binding protein